MTGGWTAEQVARIDAADELRIAVLRADGTARRPLPVWAVTVDGQVYVRTWHRRDTGWYGRVLVTRRASVSVPGAHADVRVEDVSTGSPDLRAAVDAAYRDKYAAYGAATVDRMVADDAAATTLRLTPDRPGPSHGDR